MAVEQKWPAVAPKLFTTNGSSLGVINLVNTKGLKVKQRIVLAAASLPDLQVQVKRVYRTQIIVGPLVAEQGKQLLTARTDVSAYTLALGAHLFAEEQDKSRLKLDDMEAATYDQEPTCAWREVQVDQFGDYIDTVTGVDGLNRLAVDAAVTVTGIDVDLDALEPPTRPDPDNVLIAGSEDGTKTGLKHAARVDPALDLRVGISFGANKAEVNASNELFVTDAGTHTGLAAIVTALSNVQVDLDALTPPNKADPDNVLVAGSTDGTKGGVKAPMRVDLEGNVKTINIGQIVRKYFDYIDPTYPSLTQEVYTFKVGGSGGTVVVIVTVNYTDASKEVLGPVSVVEF